MLKYGDVSSCLSNREISTQLVLFHFGEQSEKDTGASSSAVVDGRTSTLDSEKESSSYALKASNQTSGERTSSKVISFCPPVPIGRYKVQRGFRAVWNHGRNISL